MFLRRTVCFLLLVFLFLFFLYEDGVDIGDVGVLAWSGYWYCFWVIARLVWGLSFQKSAAYEIWGVLRGGRFQK